MTCTQLEDKTAVSGTIEFALKEYADLGEHLKTCQDCQAFAETEMRLDELLMKSRPALTESLPTLTFNKPLWFQPIWGLAAMILLAAFIAFQFMPEERKEQQGQTESPRSESAPSVPQSLKHKVDPEKPIQIEEGELDTSKINPQDDGEPASTSSLSSRLEPGKNQPETKKEKQDREPPAISGVMEIAEGNNSPDADRYKTPLPAKSPEYYPAEKSTPKKAEEGIAPQPETGQSPTDNLGASFLEEAKEPMPSPGRTTAEVGSSAVRKPDGRALKSSESDPSATGLAGSSEDKDRSSPADLETMKESIGRLEEAGKAQPRSEDEVTQEKPSSDLSDTIAKKHKAPSTQQPDKAVAILMIQARILDPPDKADERQNDIRHFDLVHNPTQQVIVQIIEVSGGTSTPFKPGQIVSFGLNSKLSPGIAMFKLLPVNHSPNQFGLLGVEMAPLQ